MHSPARMIAFEAAHRDHGTIDDANQVTLTRYRNAQSSGSSAAHFTRHQGKATTLSVNADAMTLQCYRSAGRHHLRPHFGTADYRASRCGVDINKY